MCDGTNGTPDLRNRFIVGSGGEYSIGNTGGEKTHALTTAEMPSHNHTATTTVKSTTAEGSASVLSYKSVGSSTGSGVAIGNGGGTTNGQYAKTLSFDVSMSHNHTATTTVGNKGSGTAHENRPPYYALAFIMKA